MNISAGDEMIFRYVKSEAGYKHLGIRATGSGKLTVLLNDAEVGEVIVENGVQTAGVICAPAGEYELKLRVEKEDDLEILEAVPE
ncbi:MAG: hypothetical protein LUE92_17320 [Clostridiales bacterium]|nr:hypothetical protein [Clostridiales bacterium]